MNEAITITLLVYCGGCVLVCICEIVWGLVFEQEKLRDSFGPFPFSPFMKLAIFLAASVLFLVFSPIAMPYYAARELYDYFSEAPE